MTSIADAQCQNFVGFGYDQRHGGLSVVDESERGQAKFQEHHVADCAEVLEHVAQQWPELPIFIMPNGFASVACFRLLCSDASVKHSARVKGVTAISAGLALGKKASSPSTKQLQA